LFERNLIADNSRNPDRMVYILVIRNRRRRRHILPIAAAVVVDHHKHYLSLHNHLG